MGPPKLSLVATCFEMAEQIMRLTERSPLDAAELTNQLNLGRW
jgi:hypothetical protein